MTHFRSRLFLAAGLAATAACSAGAPAAVAPTPAVAPIRADLPGRLEVVGRGPVTSTRTTDLWVLERDGRRFAYTGTGIFGVCPDCKGNKVFVWDVTDPARPVRTDSLVMDARIVYDVVANREGTLLVATREGAESRRNGIVIYDLADPAHPRQVSEYWETLTGGARAAWIDGNFVYVVDAGTEDLAVIDISNLADPRQVGRWGTPVRPGKYLSHVHVQDGLAYLAYWNDGLVILDVGRGIKEGTPQNPKLVSQFRYQTEWRGQRYGNTHYVFPYTNRAGRTYAFVGDEIMAGGAVDFSKPIATGGILHVIDLANLEAPLEVASFEVQGAGVHNFWVENDLLAMAAYSGGVRVLDVSGDLRGSLANREVAALSTAASDSTQAVVPNLPMAWGAMWAGGLVYASDLNSGLWVTRLVR